GFPSFLTKSDEWWSTSGSRRVVPFRISRRQMRLRRLPLGDPHRGCSFNNMEWALSTKPGLRVDFDVAVVGPRPSGATMALLIARTGLSALLIHPPQRTNPGRAETTSLRGQLPLDARGLANLLRETAIAPIRRFASRWGPEISRRSAMLSVDGSQVIV